MAGTPRTTLPAGRGMWFVRYGLPLLLLVSGGVLIGLGHASTRSPAATTGLVLAGLALTVWMLNWLFRMSIESNQDREKEEQARDYFTRHGHWPGEGE
jgi:threonine/homoserine/homoserine lactone efflux protein